MEQQRPPSAIGSGIIVLTRWPAKGRRKARLRGSSTPYEHETVQLAEEEAERLATKFGKPFEIYQRISIVEPTATTDTAEEMPAKAPSEPVKPARRKIGLPAASKA